MLSYAKSAITRSAERIQKRWNLTLEESKNKPIYKKSIVLL